MANKLLYSTFIGLKVRIIMSTQEDLVGLEGNIVDETKNLIVISSGEKKVNIPKISSVFRFFPDGEEPVDVEGRKIMFRPHERPKKV